MSERLFFGTVVVNTPREFAAYSLLLIDTTQERAAARARRWALAQQPDGEVTDVKMYPATEQVVRRAAAALPAENPAALRDSEPRREWLRYAGAAAAFTVGPWLLGALGAAGWCAAKWLIGG